MTGGEPERPSPRAPAATRPVAGEATAAYALALAIESQTALLDALVSSTQAQIRALIELRVHRDGGEALALCQAEVQHLTRRLETSGADTRHRAQLLAEALGLSPASTLTELAQALPPREREAALDRVSALRSVSQALAELQMIAQAHAQRGLMTVAAWRTALGVADDLGATYTRNGRARARHTGPLPTLGLDLDL